MDMTWRYPDGIQFLSYWSKLAVFRQLPPSDGSIVDLVVAIGMQLTVNILCKCSANSGLINVSGNSIRHKLSSSSPVTNHIKKWGDFAAENLQ